MSARKITLRKAHHLKKTLVGEIAQRIMKINQWNAQLRRPSTIDVKKLHEELKALKANLIELKTQITLANVSIYSTIVELEETKAEISFYERLNVTEYITVFDPVEKINVEKKLDLGITGEEAEEILKSLKEKIETLSDRIDGYNTNTYISIGF